MILSWTFTYFCTVCIGNEFAGEFALDLYQREKPHIVCVALLSPYNGVIMLCAEALGLPTCVRMSATDTALRLLLPSTAVQPLSKVFSCHCESCTYMTPACRIAIGCRYLMPWAPNGLVTLTLLDNLHKALDPPLNVCAQCIPICSPPTVWPHFFHLVPYLLQTHYQ